MHSSTMADEIRDSLSQRAPLPEHVAASFAAEQRRLGAGGPPEGVPSPPAAMPDGELLDVHGRPTSLTAAREGSPAVAVFYRGAWCPYCNVALRTYDRELFEPLARDGIRLIAVSPQRPDGSITIQQNQQLRLTVLSDPGNQIASQLDILSGPSEDTRKAQAELGLDLAEVNADGTRAIPMPTVVLIDGDGEIAWLDVQPDYSKRTEPALVLEAAASLPRRS